jgi:hypothetical protein
MCNTQYLVRIETRKKFLNVMVLSGVTGVDRGAGMRKLMQQLRVIHHLYRLERPLQTLRLLHGTAGEEGVAARDFEDTAVNPRHEISFLHISFDCGVIGGDEFLCDQTSVKRDLL